MPIRRNALSRARLFWLATAYAATAFAGDPARAHFACDESSSCAKSLVVAQSAPPPRPSSTPPPPQKKSIEEVSTELVQMEIRRLERLAAGPLTEASRAKLKADIEELVRDARVLGRTIALPPALQVIAASPPQAPLAVAQAPVAVAQATSSPPREAPRPRDIVKARLDSIYESLKLILEHAWKILLAIIDIFRETARDSIWFPLIMAGLILVLIVDRLLAILERFFPSIRRTALGAISRIDSQTTSSSSPPPSPSKQTYQAPPAYQAAPMLVDAYTPGDARQPSDRAAPRSDERLRAEPPRALAKGFGIAALVFAITAIFFPFGIFVSAFAILLAVAAAFAGDRVFGVATASIVAVNTFALSPLTYMWLAGASDQGVYQPFLAGLVGFCALPIGAMLLRSVVRRT